ncbi:hypothetical protein E4U30_002985 [Claviceps sp. LM220 group G6]|nr:hypothetical protein E4U30_002985 [Claviceps sp. LM220 group G6]
MQDQSPALLESNLLAISKIMPEMRRKGKKHRKPRYKLQLEQCHRQGGYACTLSMGIPVIVGGSASQLTARMRADC